jgi:hypothetical protein
MVLRPIKIDTEPVDARQILINDSLATIEGLPHGDIAIGMSSDDKVVHFTQAVHWVVLVHVWNV